MKQKNPPGRNCYPQYLTVDTTVTCNTEITPVGPLLMDSVIGSDHANLFFSDCISANPKCPVSAQQPGVRLQHTPFGPAPG
jgi:hypothetical protein